jgi:hypothetical protein
LFVLVMMPVLADTEFRAARMTSGPRGKGQCDIRLQIDQDAEVRVRGDWVSVRTISGRDAHDDGSACSEPLPGPWLRGFNFEVRNKRGDIALLSPPSGRNAYAAVVRIRDSASGAGHYHFRLSWAMNAFSPGPSDSPPKDHFGVREATEVCREAVTRRIANSHDYSDVDIGHLQVDDRPGRVIYVLGVANARRHRHATSLTFVCSVDVDSGRVRSVDVNER